MCVCVPSQTQSTKMHALSLKGMDEVFSSESLLKKKSTPHVLLRQWSLQQYPTPTPPTTHPSPQPHSFSALASPLRGEAVAYA